MRPQAIIWAYWQEIINLEMGAMLLEPVYFDSSPEVNDDDI